MAAQVNGRARLPQLVTGAFACWAVLLWLLYYGAETHVRAWEPWTPEAGLAGRWLVFSAALVVGAGLLFLRSSRAIAARGNNWPVLLIIALAVAVAAAVPGLRSRVTVGILALGTVGAAAGFGALLLRRLGVRARGAAEELAWSGALGLGTMALVFTLLGLVGLFNVWALSLAALAMLVAGGRDLLRLVERLGEGLARLWRRAGLGGSALVILAVALLAWRAAYCFAPPGLGEADYDALEYHVAAPLQWLLAGRVAFLPGNVYANMPAGAEMLYSLGLSAAPGFYAGYAFTKLLGLLALGLAALAVHGAGRRLAGRRAGVLAAAIFFGGMWAGDLVAAPFIEPFLILYATVAWTMLAAAAARRGGNLRLVAAGALAAGFAAATKYTAAAFVAAPVVVAAGLAFVRTPKRALAALALAGALALVPIAPWLARNWLADGDPVYPQATSVFPSRHWDSSKAARWAKAHAPSLSPARAVWRAVAGDPKANDIDMWKNIFTGPALYLFLPLLPVGLLLRRRRAAVFGLVLAGFAAVYVIGWATMTHQIARFLYPAYGAIAALGAAGVLAAGGRAAGAAAGIGRLRAEVPALVLLAAMLFAVPAEIRCTMAFRGEPDLSTLAGLAPEEEFLARLPGGTWQAIAKINSLPAGSKVLLVGEARLALFRVPAGCATVFDTHPLEEALARSTGPKAKDPAALLAVTLRSEGYTHIYYDQAELDRLRGSYSAKLPDGKDVPGCFALSDEQVKVLQEFERQWLELVGAGGQECRSILTGRPARALELWKIKMSFGELEDAEE